MPPRKPSNGAPPQNLEAVWERTRHETPHRRSRALGIHLADLLDLDPVDFAGALHAYDKKAGRRR